MSNISWTSKRRPALLFGWNPWWPLSVKDIYLDLRCNNWSKYVTATEDALKWWYQYCMSNASNSNMHLMRTAGLYHDSILLQWCNGLLSFMVHFKLFPLFSNSPLSSLMTFHPFIYTVVPSTTAGPTRGGPAWNCGIIWHQLSLQGYREIKGMVWSDELKKELKDGAMLSEISPLSLMGMVDCLIALPFWPWKEAVSVCPYATKHFFSNG